jgi:hypothetical protein
MQSTADQEGTRTDEAIAQYMRGFLVPLIPAAAVSLAALVLLASA